MKQPQPRIIAHRGASGIALENSLAAFQAALEARVDGIELDIHLSRTGDLVVHHDPDLPGIGPIAGIDLKAIRGQRLSNGEPIPTLREVLNLLLRGNQEAPEVWIEVKALPEAGDATLLECIAGSPLPHRCAVHSFDHRIIKRLGARHPTLRGGVLSASYPLDPVTPVLAAGAEALWQEWRLIDGPMVEAIHRAGRELIAWTVNEREPAVALAELGVDALCGNWPDRLKVW